MARRLSGDPMLDQIDEALLVMRAEVWRLREKLDQVEEHLKAASRMMEMWLVQQQEAGDEPD